MGSRRPPSTGGRNPTEPNTVQPANPVPGSRHAGCKCNGLDIMGQAMEDRRPKLHAMLGVLLAALNCVLAWVLFVGLQVRGAECMGRASVDGTAHRMEGTPDVIGLGSGAALDARGFCVRFVLRLHSRGWPACEAGAEPSSRLGGGIALPIACEMEGCGRSQA